MGEATRSPARPASPAVVNGGWPHERDQAPGEWPAPGRVDGRSAGTDPRGGYPAEPSGATVRQTARTVHGEIRVRRGGDRRVLVDRGAGTPVVGGASGGTGARAALRAPGRVAARVPARARVRAAAAQPARRIPVRRTDDELVLALQVRAPASSRVSGYAAEPGVLQLPVPRPGQRDRVPAGQLPSRTLSGRLRQHRS